jgi:hypothetical protein
MTNPDEVREAVARIEAFLKHAEAVHADCLRKIEALETARAVEMHVFRKGLVNELRDLPLTITRYGKPVAHVLPTAPSPQVKP